MRDEIPAPAVAALSYIDRKREDGRTNHLPASVRRGGGQLAQSDPVACAIKLLLCPIILATRAEELLRSVMLDSVGRSGAARWPQNANLLARGRELTESS
jgi:hypothetical protein